MKKQSIVIGNQRLFYYDNKWWLRLSTAWYMFRIFLMSPRYFYAMVSYMRRRRHDQR